MENKKLFMLLLGCKPKGRHTEQHDIFFGAGASLKDLVPDMLAFWPDAGTIHIDAWRTVTEVDGYAISFIPRDQQTIPFDTNNPQLFFINLGGYKENEFEEFHYKMLVVGKDKGEAIQKAKESAFYKHTGFTGAVSHIDDKYGVDVDDLFELEDILPAHIKQVYSLQITAVQNTPKDEWTLGYTKLSSLLPKNIS